MLMKGQLSNLSEVKGDVCVT